MNRLHNLADWIERDRREPDKVLAYAQDVKRMARALDDAEVERIALADAFRSTLVNQGMHPTTAALAVQHIIDQAAERQAEARALAENVTERERVLGRPNGR